MLNVSTVHAVVAVDSVVVTEFIVSAAPLTWYVGSEVAYLGGGQKFCRKFLRLIREYIRYKYRTQSSSHPSDMQTVCCKILSEIRSDYATTKVC